MTNEKDPNEHSSESEGGACEDETNGSTSNSSEPDPPPPGGGDDPGAPAQPIVELLHNHRLVQADDSGKPRQNLQRFLVD